MRAAIVSTYPPRACGIGAFAADVRAALLGVEGVDRVERIVVVDEPSRPQRPGLVATIAQAVRGDYVRAARILGRLDVDVVLLQHEFGIFGGRDGEYVLSFAEELSQPLVVTLHTVLSEPTPHQAKVMSALCEQAEIVVVMTDTGRRLLVDSGVCAAEKVQVVPHGAPAVIARRAAEVAAAAAGTNGGSSSKSRTRKIDNRFVLSTFGLISAGKGLETAIAALPAIVERHPEVLYIIAGRTHPDVARRDGERYRLSLEESVVDLGLEDHVEFDGRFLTVDEIADLLAVTDVFVTPYRGLEQISSGALSFAVAAGCAVVSTPYWHAQDLLATGAGTIVPFDDPATLAEAVCRYIDEPDVLAEARAEARRMGKELGWPSVAKATAAVLKEAMERAPRRRSAAGPEPLITNVKTDHILTLADDVGIVQHANGVIPNRDTGYCVDDVARLAVVALELARRGDEQAWTSMVYRSISFLEAATVPDVGMRNFMGYDRSWLDEPHLGDHVGRTAWALGEILSTAWVPALVGPTRRLLDSIVAMLAPKVSLRTGAYAALGLARLDHDRLGPEDRVLLELTLERLLVAYRTTASEDWSWFEDRLTYDNARLPHALIAGGTALGRDDLVEVGLSTLLWLGNESGLEDGTLRLTGHLGRTRGEPAPGGGDEQPLDASAFVEAELAAFAVTGDRSHGVRAQRSYDWFLGRNRLRRPLYDFATGGCCDGLGEETTNDNEGAESTLAFHRSALLLDAAGLPAVRRERLQEQAIV